MTVIPEFKRKKQEGWEFKVMFDYIMSVRTVWDTEDPTPSSRNACMFMYI